MSPADRARDSPVVVRVLQSWHKEAEAGGAGEGTRRPSFRAGLPGAERRAAPRTDGAAVEADCAANVVRLEEPARPRPCGWGRAARRVVVADSRVHRRAGPHFVVESEDVAELVRDDQGHL